MIHLPVFCGGCLRAKLVTDGCLSRAPGALSDLSEQAQNRRELPAHAYKLFEHVQRNFDSGQIDSHFTHENLRHTDSIDLLQWIKFSPAPAHRLDHFLLLESTDEFRADVTRFDNVSQAKIFPAAVFALYRITSLRMSSPYALSSFSIASFSTAALGTCTIRRK